LIQDVRRFEMIRSKATRTEAFRCLVGLAMAAAVVVALLSVGRARGAEGLDYLMLWTVEVSELSPAPGASPPDSVVAALEELCPSCDVEMGRDGLRAAGAQGELSLELVVATLKRHGYGWAACGYSKTWDLAHLGGELLSLGRG
jgi:hypothetical protein